MAKKQWKKGLWIGGLVGLISAILIVGLMLLLNYTTEGIVEIKSLDSITASTIFYFSLIILAYIFAVTLGVTIVSLISKRTWTKLLNSLWISVVLTSIIFGFMLFTLKDKTDVGFATGALIFIILPFLSIIFLVPIFVGSLINKK